MKGSGGFDAGNSTQTQRSSVPFWQQNLGAGLSGVSVTPSPTGAVGAGLSGVSVTPSPTGAVGAGLSGVSVTPSKTGAVGAGLSGVVA